jgi:hypothetical protein
LRHLNRNPESRRRGEASTRKAFACTSDRAYWPTGQVALHIQNINAYKRLQGRLVRFTVSRAVASLINIWDGRACWTQPSDEDCGLAARAVQPTKKGVTITRNAFV